MITLIRANPTETTRSRRKLNLAVFTACMYRYFSWFIFRPWRCRRYIPPKRPYFSELYGVKAHTTDLFRKFVVEYCLLEVTRKISQHVCCLMCDHQFIISWSTRIRTQRTDTIQLTAEGDHRLLLSGLLLWHGIPARSTRLPKHATHCLLLGNNRTERLKKKGWNSPETFVGSHECSDGKFFNSYVFVTASNWLLSLVCLYRYCQFAIACVLLFLPSLKCETISFVMPHPFRGGLLLPYSGQNKQMEQETSIPNGLV